MTLAHDAIAQFQAQVRDFAGTCNALVTFSNKSEHHLDILWQVHAALGGVVTDPARRERFEFYPNNELLRTERGDGVLLQHVPVGNYGPPEIRISYSLLVGDDVCVQMCDRNHPDLIIEEVTFEVETRAPAILEQVVQALTAAHAAVGASLSKREDKSPTLLFLHRGMQEGDDDVRCWSLDHGRVAVEVCGSSRRTFVLRPSDALEIVVRQFAEGEDTELFLIRDGVCTRIATGAIAMTVQGLHGPTLAQQLRAHVRCDVRLKVIKSTSA